MRVAVLFLRFGPYHVARLEAAGREIAADGGELAGIEVARTSQTYAWGPVAGGRHFCRLTLFEGRVYEDIAKRETHAAVAAALAAFRPDVVVLPGWSASESCAALSWAMRAGVPTVMMSESARADAPRYSWSEAVKRRLLGCCSAALVGGRRHVDYLVELGMPRDRVFLGYDVVDNDYFRSGAATARSQADALRRRFRLPARYFLTSSRFIEKKNLSRLLSAFASYRAQAGTGAWDLVLCGSGELHHALEAQVESLGIGASVHFSGFVQYEDLPVYYGLASAFVHVSTIEQWGLVVNEAAASGLPVLVSERCGCVTELVVDGRNGWLLDPLNEEGMVRAMLEVGADLSRAAGMGRESQAIVSAFSPRRFGEGLASAVTSALAGPRRRRLALVDRCLASVMAMRAPDPS